MAATNLVIVESPAKAKTIEKFLGKDYKVMSSYGHIRDLKRKALSIDETSLMPDYEIPAEKRDVVRELKAARKAAAQVWLASDEDREGEAISWHLCVVLGLDPKETPRIVFHEITEGAIREAIKNPRRLDMNLVNAQQARRVLDRLVGFRLSPVLWRKVKPALSAGRVQSVAVRLIVEREREIQTFESKPAWVVRAVFAQPGAAAADLKAELNTRYKTRAEAEALLRDCAGAVYTIEDIDRRPLKRTPAPPFTTSTLQQEAARRLGFSVSQTMSIAQRLYESGLITYMRTDSVNLSGLCLNAAKQEIVSVYGERYHHLRQYQTHSKGAQEAHEAIRPTYMTNATIEGTPQERRLYELIWKRTAASQMADAELEKTTVSVSISGRKEMFVATGEVVRFDGFLKAYHDTPADDAANAEPEQKYALPPLTVGDRLERDTITATERYPQGPARYNEAALVHKLEELGIGRPSTYAPTISTIQQREYVVKGDRKGTPRQYGQLTLKGGTIAAEEQTEMAGAEKGKLLPTDIGLVVNDFLTEHFPQILDYNFTASVEREFDEIAAGGEAWTQMMHSFYDHFNPTVERAMNDRSEHKAGERELGADADGKPVYVKIGRFGPMVQIGAADDKEKPRFAQLPKTLSIETITLDEALELFRLPRHLGQWEGSDVVIGTGRFGPYVLHNKKYTSLPKDADPLTITLDEATALVRAKAEEEAKRHISTFDHDGKPLEVINGRFGPYIAYGGANYKIPKADQARAAELTLDECVRIIETAPAKPAKRGRKAKNQ